MRTMRDVCLGLAALLVPTVGEEDVFALDRMDFLIDGSTVTVHPGTLGEFVKQVGEQVEVDWKIAEAVRGSVNEGLVERANCTHSCPGTLAFLEVASEVLWDEEMEKKDKCQIMLGHANASSCGLADQQQARCPRLFDFLRIRADYCGQVGVNLTVPNVPSVFEKTSCTYCSTFQGALPLSGTPFPEHLVIARHACETQCLQDDGCRSYDYESMRGECRLWKWCPTNTWRESSCQWNLYMRPSSQASGDEPSTTLGQNTPLEGESELTNTTTSVVPGFGLRGNIGQINGVIRTAPWLAFATVLCAGVA